MRNLPVQIVEAKGVNESIFLGIPHNGRRERERGVGGGWDEQRGIEFLPKDGRTEHMWPPLFVVVLALCPTDCHMVKIWAKWGEHLASYASSPSSFLEFQQEHPFSLVNLGLKITPWRAQKWKEAGKSRHKYY